MNKLVFGLIATVMISIIGRAQSENDFSQKSKFKSASFTTKFNNETVNYNFKTLDEFNEGSEGIFQSFDFQNSESGKLQEDKCNVTITLAVEVIMGIRTASLSAIATTSCTESVEAAKRLKEMVLSAALGD